MIKRILFLYFLLLLTIHLHAQSALFKSHQNRGDIFIYKTDSTFLRKLHYQGEVSQTDISGPSINRYKSGETIPQMRRGNYLLINTQNDELEISEHTIDNIIISVIPDKKLMICLYDSTGHIISDAIVKCDRNRLKFNPVLKAYTGGVIKTKKTIEINNKGIFHYISVENNQNRYMQNYSWFELFRDKISHQLYSLKYKLKAIINKDYSDEAKGFFVFNKPLYKPGETVRFKAYITKNNGKPYKQSLTFSLNGFRTDTILAKDLTPYRPGMFEYEFKLTDSLKLSLDKDYDICFRRKDNNIHISGNSFRYEEYNLKSTLLSLSADKNEHLKGDSVALSVKITDSNFMPVYGGYASIIVTPGKIQKQESKQLLFVKDTLWQKDIDMTEVAEKKVFIPDSIFPAGMSLSYNVHCSYTGPDNEKRNSKKIIYRNSDSYFIQTEIKNGQINIKQIKDGKTIKTKAKISINQHLYSTDSVSLPYAFSLPWYASDISVKTPFSEKSIKPENTANPIKCDLYRENDSIICRVTNPTAIPFWYKLHKGKKEIKKGHTNSLNISFPDTDQSGYELSVSYIYGGSSQTISSSLPYIRKNISMDITTPDKVYPGQKTNVRIKLTDSKQRAVEDADITAFGITSKFNKNVMPNLSVEGKISFAKKIKINNLTDTKKIISTSRKLDWDYWRKELLLDTAEIYKFLYPDKYYKTTTSTKDSSTLLMPFIVKDGKAQGIQLLWIDGRLHYSRISDMATNNIFEITPGYHDLKIRTSTNEIEISNVMADTGVKNIYSFNIGTNNWICNYNNIQAPLSLNCRIANKDRSACLTDKEIAVLSKNLIRIENTSNELELPNSYVRIGLPSYVRSGDQFFLLNCDQLNFNIRRRADQKTKYIAGPFPLQKQINDYFNYIAYCNYPAIPIRFTPEGGYNYTLFENYQKIKSWDNFPFSEKMHDYTPDLNFNQELLTADSIRTRSNRIINNTISALNGPAVIPDKGIDKYATCKLNITLGKKQTGEEIIPLLFRYKSEEEATSGIIYYGGTRSFNNLPEGKGTLYLILRDSTVYTTDLLLHKNGQSYLTIDSIASELNQEVSASVFTQLRNQMKLISKRNPYVYSEPDSCTHIEGIRKISESVLSGIITDSTGEPILGATVTIIGSQTGTVSGVNGEFSIQAKAGDKVRIAYIGFDIQVIDFIPGSFVNISLSELSYNLEESVVTAYGSAKRTSIIHSELNRAYPGIQINAAPLIIVNGLPYYGEVTDFEQTSISKTTRLFGSEATGLFGSMAANGVIILEGTNIKLSEKSQTPDIQITENEANSIRKNFKDDAFWQPRLKTNKMGIAEFEITYPDDITSWDAYFIAVGNRKQTDKKRIAIKSFKSLTAQLSLPRFTIAGDSIDAIGHITNYRNDSIKLVRKTTVDGIVDSTSLRLKSSFTEAIPFSTNDKDSVVVSYVIESENGYKDGEERSLPVLRKGLVKHHGEFRILNDSIPYTFIPDPDLGTVSFYAASTPLNYIIRQINEVDNYPFYCNEQIASKIKVLIARKRIAHALNDKFSDNVKIKSLIRKLENNQNQDGLWGWWNKSATQQWISEQIIEALAEAEKEGYVSSFRKNKITKALENQITRTLHNLLLNHIDYNSAIKNRLINQLIYLKQLKPDADLSKVYNEVSNLKNLSTSNKLKTYYAQSIFEPESDICVDSIMNLSKKTILGSTYWNESVDNQIERGHFRNPGNIETENTLLAYRLLKIENADPLMLESVRNYFFENTSNGNWSNTYVSSRIIECILPDLLKCNKENKSNSIRVNETKVSDFPFSCTFTPNEKISINNDCATPLFVSFSQKEIVTNPGTESDKGFSIETRLNGNTDSLCFLSMNQSLELKAIVKCKEAGSYIQIEIPVPAGCEFEKSKSRLSEYEIHREYYKDKVVIFCNSLPKGEHIFNVALSPRFSGRYTINPAKAELMYHPVFFGNNKIKTLNILE